MIYICLLFFSLWVLYKHTTGKINSMEQAFTEENTGHVKGNSGNKYNNNQIIIKIVAIVLCVFGIFSICVGCGKNYKITRLKKNGTRATARVIDCNMRNDFFIKGDINLYDYVVEFLADDNVVYGKGITMGIYVSKDEMVDIYYLYNHTDSDIDVTIADKNDKPGRNTVYHGILELVMGLGCVVTIIKKGY